MSDTTITVRDNPQGHRFEADINGHLAIAAYRHSHGVVTFTHTQVPDELQGQGIAGKLITGALEQIRERGEKIVAECPYVVSFLKKHPEYQDLVAE